MHIAYNWTFALGLGIAAFIVSQCAGPVVIPRLRTLKFGQAIREEGPQAHLAKAGTPTMGGIIFLVAVWIPLALVLAFENLKLLYVLSAMTLFGLIGFLDDYLKVIKHHNEGLKAREKFCLQMLAAIGFAVWGASWGTHVSFPLIAGGVDIGLFYIPIMALMYVAVDNAVNFTDGLDGLATTVTLVVSLFFLVMSIVQGQMEAMILSATVIGALFGYLRFNWHPARVFMGDMGSLALGGYVASMSVLLGIPFFIPLFGCIYFVEILSVIIQVLVYKKTQKRVFKMAPIHHHYELKGLSEVRIVLRFSAVTLLGCLITFVLYRG